MLRSLAAIASTLMLAGGVSAADAKKLTIRWYGQSYFEVTTTAGTRLVFDPHNIDFFGRHMVKADIVCVSHNHNDHNQLEMIENLRQAKVLMGLKDVKGDRKREEWNQIDEKIKDVHVRTVGVYHDDVQGMERGKNTSFIIEADGLRIAHLGDLGHTLTPALVKRIGPLDVLMIPVGGVYTLNGEEAKKVVAQLKPKRYILPMHYAVRGYDAMLPADEFLEDQKATNIHRPRGNELAIDPTAKPPAEPIIEMLNWQSK
jgi:L-ascorbate metabolism protein UlaG (beta-lactamase superfamily)